LSYFISIQIKKKSPKNVDIINYEDFFTNIKKNRLVKKFNIKLKEFNNNATYFNYEDNRGWLCPDGKFRSLISENEKNLIQSTCLDNKYKTKKKSFISYTVSFFIFTFISIAKVNVHISKKILDFFFFPRLIIKSFLLNMLIVKKMKSFLKKLIN
jgi:hypothetical protein